MTWWNRLGLRTRLTIVFTAGTAVVLAALSLFAYWRNAANLLDAADAGLRSRGEILAADVRAKGTTIPNFGAELIEHDEAFEQIANASGKIVQSSRIVAETPLLSAATIRALDHPKLFSRTIPGIDAVTRVLAVPTKTPSGDRAFVLVGTSLQDRRDAMLQLAATFAIGGPLALAILSAAGWLLAGAALRPVERMRSEAAEISSAAETRRLTTPPSDDEVARLAATLNRMLDRIQASAETERRFLDQASHELRTPIGILRSEVELALSRSRTEDELVAALESVSAEANHLSLLADDLLVLSRAQQGNLPLHLEPVSLRALAAAASDRFDAAARRAGVHLEVDVSETTLEADPVRLRQALDNLLANALRHTGSGDSIRVSSGSADGWTRLVVEDTGPGFPRAIVDRVFEPFVRADGDDSDGTGLGLPIVRAIAEAHGGSSTADNRPEGGARVTVSIPSRITAGSGPAPTTA